MNLGIFGGSFDPVHMGHLILAERCREQAGLDRVLFIPAARPPHKPDIAQTPFRNRVEMLELALSGNPAFTIDETGERTHRAQLHGRHAPDHSHARRRDAVADPRRRFRQ